MNKIISLLSLLLCLASCGSIENIAPAITRVSVYLGSGSESSATKAPTRSSALPDEVASLVLTVTAPDMESIVETTELSGEEEITISVNVPTGSGRVFRMDALNASGVLLYSGREILDLDGSPVALVIHMIPSINTVFMEANASMSDEDTVAVDIMINETSGVYGAAFEIIFDETMLSYESLGGGDFLEKDGVPASYQAALQPDNSGVLIAGATRLGLTGGVDGSGRIMTVTFRRVSSGSSILSFRNTGLRGPANLDINGITWVGTGIVNP